MIRTWSEGKKVLSTKVISKKLDWVTSPWIINTTSESMQKSVSFEVGVQKTVTYSGGIQVSLSSALSLGFEKSISWAESVTKVDTTTISIKPRRKGAIKYESGHCVIEIVVRQTFFSKETNGHCGIISNDSWNKDTKDYVTVKVHMGDAVGIEEKLAPDEKFLRSGTVRPFFWHSLLTTGINTDIKIKTCSAKEMIKQVEKKKESLEHVACLKSKEFGFRLSAETAKSVRLSSQHRKNEEWIWEWISENKFHWKSKAFGTYLRANPDGHLDLATKPNAWEIWTKVEFGSHIFWRSHFETYLSANPDKTVCLTKNKLKHQQWAH